ncbi:MAG: bifunctional phosphoglucose/phosphomannose isomerase [Patescibacteria group bacterium]|nr:bifunctional phosphoglucose/phosphomannose isomerase [Patescibacteria group bacterium]
MDNLDPKNVLGSTEMLADQCKQIWEDAKSLEFPDSYKNCQNIILCGMGGSAYGGYVVSSLFKDSLKASIISNNDYGLPAFANENSLIFLSSYSGSTEEVLSCAQKAQEKNLKITGTTSGGKLGDLFKDEEAPGLIFDPKFNPSAQPRLGTGYMVLGSIGLLNKLGVISVSDEEVSKAISELEENTEDIKAKAKSLVEKIKGFIPVIISAEFLAGNAHIMRNQFNETAKSFAAYSQLPELNHHLMEGLKNPADRKLLMLFIASDMYSDKLKKRLELTKDVVNKNNVNYEEYVAEGSSKLSQMLNVLSFGGFLTLYLAFLYGEDPSLIPWVDYFKEQLAK